MNPKYKPMFQEYQLKDKIILKNRFILAPLTHSSSNDDGTISQEELYYIEKNQKM